MILFILVLVLWAAQLLAPGSAISTFWNRWFPKIWVLPLIMMAVGVSLDMAGFPEDSWAYNQCIEFCAVCLIACPFYIWRLSVKKKNDYMAAASGQKVETINLPKSLPGRVRIIKEFDKKYQLNLTDPQCQLIADCSFQNCFWTDEVAAMMNKYDSINQWYNNENGWLRAYLRVFNVQNIIADYELQKTVCLKNFMEIFDGKDMSTYPSIADYIDEVNKEYLVNFDESTFMLAYNFAKDNGKEYKLPAMDVVKIVDPTDTSELEEKYQVKKK